jgi:arabinogalactan oligomer/maltooligosaccharide transport system permease protein
MSSTTLSPTQGNKNKGGNYKQTQRFFLIIRMFILSLGVLFAIFPVIWIMSTAINPSQSMGSQVQYLEDEEGNRTRFVDLGSSMIPNLQRSVRTSTAGEVVELLVEEGQYVLDEDIVAIIQGDEVTVEVIAPLDGHIKDLTIELGSTVERSQELMVLDGDAGNLLVNFRTLLDNERKPYMLWIRNSMIVSTTTSIAAVLITSLAAYAFSRFRFRFRQGLLVTILLVQVFPNLLAMVALYLILQQIGRHIPVLGLDTLGGVIFVYLGGQMGINIWLMKGFFDSVPRDIDESALVDGATYSQVYWMLIFPLVRPILIVVGILTFVGTFNEFVLARVLLQNAENWTLMVGLFSFIGDNFSQNWGVFAAGALLGALPTLAIYLLLQDQIVGGLTQGSVKG